MALRHIKEFIDNRTQPSPCAAVTSHNFEPGNHSRSVADGSLVCNKPHLCKEKAIRYMMGTKLDLYTNVMSDLKAAVSWILKVKASLYYVHVYSCQAKDRHGHKLSVGVIGCICAMVRGQIKWQSNTHKSRG